MAADASQELSELDQKLVDATSRFDRMPGALWLAATAIIESASRMGDALPAALEERRQELLVRARRARDDAGPRSSENDVSAITAWVERAEKRAALERVVKTALGEIETHRAAHRWLGEAIASRKALERALGERERDVVAREKRIAEPVDDAELRQASVLQGDDHDASDDELERRSRAARVMLRSAKPWHAWASGFVGASGLVLAVLAPPPVCYLLLVQTVLSAVATLGLRKRRRRNLPVAYALRRRDDARAEPARTDHGRLVAAAKALGALDAFGATDDGRTLEDRESKLVALAPWIRELVSGFTTEEAKRFE
jgi:hypothetical protein